MITEFKQAVNAKKSDTVTPPKLWHPYHTPNYAPPTKSGWIHPCITLHENEHSLTRFTMNTHDKSY